MIADLSSPGDMSRQELTASTDTPTGRHLGEIPQYDRFRRPSSPPAHDEAAVHRRQSVAACGRMRLRDRHKSIIPRSGELSEK
ncbi:hypothetical protein GCM10023193_10620 [Planotetraspora kaengkrachanensis]|uniref:Uncharacterized protein n=1 Tax=Planotetraspora kaengkrachanensis TaxID=575193 RepID=A0A8J3PPW2_9ACTN|nr:hypothetical protein Pka01_06190 [Planotetraspora kaengkrachanensis]